MIVSHDCLLLLLVIAKIAEEFSSDEVVVNGKVLRQGGQSLKVEVAYVCSAQCPRLARFSLSFLERPLRRIDRLMVPNTFFYEQLGDVDERR